MARGHFADTTTTTGLKVCREEGVRVLRGEDGQSPAAAGLYPAGEGSGYAAGIVTSAVDGMKAAEQLVAAYKI